jgi:hypothetical protein
MRATCDPEVEKCNLTLEYFSVYGKGEKGIRVVKNNLRDLRV